MSSRWTALVILGAPVGLFVLSGLRAIQLAQEGEVPPDYRDLDCDGKVSRIEWLRGGIDFRVRPSEQLRGCDEVYAVKTGRAMVVRCPEPPLCRLAKDVLK